MPKYSRAKAVRMREAKRRARAAESDEARDARLARDRESHSRARDEETPEQRAERQARDLQRHKRVREERQALDSGHLHGVQKDETLEEREDRQAGDNLARFDDTDFFRVELHGDFRQALSKTSLFQCSRCGAFVWEEDRNGFCCSAKTDPTYDPTNPECGSIPPQPPDGIMELFLNQNFVKQSKQYKNALAKELIGVRVTAMPGYNRGVHIQGGEDALIPRAFYSELKVQHDQLLAECDSLRTKCNALKEENELLKEALGSSFSFSST